MNRTSFIEVLPLRRWPRRRILVRTTPLTELVLLIVRFGPFGGDDDVAPYVLVMVLVKGCRICLRTFITPVGRNVMRFRPWESRIASNFLVQTFILCCISARNSLHFIASMTDKMSSDPDLSTQIGVKLPVELEREIFELAALSRPVTIPKLMLVSWYVNKWYFLWLYMGFWPRS